MKDKELCETFGTTLEDVERDAEWYESGDFFKSDFSAPILGRPGARTKRPPKPRLAKRLTVAFKLIE